MEEKKRLTGETKEALHLGCGGRIVNHATRTGEEQCTECGIAGRPLARIPPGGNARTQENFAAVDRAIGIMFPGPVAALQRAAYEAKAEEHAALLEQLRTTTLALELVLAQPPSSDFEWAAIRATVQTSKNLIAKVEG